MGLSSNEVQMLTMYAAQVQRWGWRWKLSAADNASATLTHFGCLLDATMNAVDLQASCVILPIHCAGPADYSPG